MKSKKKLDVQKRTTTGSYQPVHHSPSSSIIHHHHQHHHQLSDNQINQRFIDHHLSIEKVSFPVKLLFPNIWLTNVLDVHSLVLVAVRVGDGSCQLPPAGEYCERQAPFRSAWIRSENDADYEKNGQSRTGWKTWSLAQKSVSDFE